VSLDCIQEVLQRNGVVVLLERGVMETNSEGVEELEDAEAGHAEVVGAHWQLQAKWARRFVCHSSFDVA
jgi:hypothetical protein